jgi:hypothetical protein
MATSPIITSSDGVPPFNGGLPSTSVPVTENVVVSTVPGTPLPQVTATETIQFQRRQPEQPSQESQITKSITENITVTQQEESPLNEYNRFDDALTNALVKTEQLNQPIVPNVNLDGTAQTINNILGLKWKNQLAIVRVYQIWNLLGRPNPDAINVNQGGMVVWQNRKTKVPNYRNEFGFYKEIIIRDEEVLDTNPNPHINFVRTSVDMRLTAEKSRHILDISGSVYYYAQAGELWATGGDLESNLAAFAAIKMYNAGVMPVEKLRKYYEFLVEIVLKEFYANEKVDINNPYSQPTPIRDVIEQYVFSTDNRALGLLGGAAIGGLLGGAIGGAPGAIGGVALGGLAGGALAGR